MSKMRVCMCLCLGLVLLSAISPAWAATLEELEARVAELEKQQADSNDFRVYWKDGLRMETADKSMQWRIGGRIDIDSAWFDQDNDLIEQLEAAGSDEPDWEDATEIRMARMYMQGLLYDKVEFKFQFDYVDGDVEPRDVYVGLTGLPFGGIRAGHFKEPFGLQQLTVGQYLTFMERALPGAFEAERNMGVMAHNHIMDDQMTWALGVFRDSDEFGAGEGDGYNFTGRVTGLPLYEDKGEQLVHLGMGYSYRHFDDEMRLRQRPEAHLTPDYLVNTGYFEADNASLLGLESAMVWGPASLQAEYTTAFVDSDERDDPDLCGYYIEASYFLTGEHRNYNAAKAVFDRIRPKRNFLGKAGGPGAWQVAARYSHLDLDDGAVNGGALDTITAGLNWYLNPNTRVMFNYVYADASDLYDGETQIFQTRFQIDF